MNVTIREHKFSLRSEYDIETPDVSYRAQRKLFSLFPRLRVFAGADRLVAEMLGRWSLFRSKYDFVLSGGNIYRFWCEKIWKGVYVAEGSTEKFQMYRHKGLNYSIFQNDVQIAAVRKNRVVIGKGNEYQIRVNAHANLLVIICMVLALNTQENDDDREMVTFDFGNVGPQARPFDDTWEPS